MSHNVNIHLAQASVLRDLLFVKDARYSELRRSSGLESDHFKFHLAKLIQLGYINKNSTGLYNLTNKGKEHANKLDTDALRLERQPKSAVLLLVQDPENDKKYLFQQRKKHPYFDFWGMLGGKIRWGETIYQAALRELKEETGLSAEVKFVGVYHEHTYDENNTDLLEDKIFFVFNCKKVKGKLISKFEGGINKYLTIAETKNLNKKYNSFDFELNYALGIVGDGDNLIELKQSYTKDEF